MPDPQPNAPFGWLAEGATFESDDTSVSKVHGFWENMTLSPGGIPGANRVIQANVPPGSYRTKAVSIAGPGQGTVWSIRTPGAYTHTQAHTPHTSRLAHASHGLRLHAAPSHFQCISMIAMRLGILGNIPTPRKVHRTPVVSHHGPSPIAAAHRPRPHLYITVRPSTQI